METTNTNTQERKNTIRGVMSEKFLDSLRRATWSDMFKALSRLSAFVFLVVCLFNIPASIQTLKKALFFYDFAILKIIASLFIVYGFGLIRRFAEVTAKILTAFWKWIIESMKIEQVEKIEHELFAGVPIIELVDYIFETRGFKRSELEERFAMSRAAIEETAKRLEELCVFKRGENNARVLTDDFARQDLVEMFRAAKTPSKLSLLSRINDEGEKTYRPRLQEIKNRLFASDGFVRRPVSGEVAE